MDRIRTQVKLWWRDLGKPHPPLTSEELLHRMWAAIRLLAIIVLLLFLAVGILEFQLLRRNSDIDTVGNSVHSMADSAEEIEKSANNIEELAQETQADLEAAIEASQAPNPQVAKALEEIHQSLVILQNLEALVANTLERLDDQGRAQG